MFYSDNRSDLRQKYISAWQKHTHSLPVEPVEAMIIDVILMHPEYHGDLITDNIDKDYSVEAGDTNPFLHMSLHIALKEQLSTDRPKSIGMLFNKALTAIADPHECEHIFIEALAEGIWEAQRQQKLPDEKQYLKRIKRLLKKRNIQ